MPAMTDTKVGSALSNGTRQTLASSAAPPTTRHADAMLCERCGKGEMYRMHAVWRCPACGFKTDCCGW